MAGYRGTLGVLQALKERLSLRMAAMLGGNPDVVLVGTQQLSTPPGSKSLGIYLYRMSIDPFARNRYLPPAEGKHTPIPEVPVNLHILLIGWSNDTESEINYLSAATQIVGSSMTLGVSQLGIADKGWSDDESVQVIPEEMSTEDLTRLWDSFPSGYRLSVPYIIKTVRLRPDQEINEGPLVKTQVFGFDTSVPEQS